MMMSFKKFISWCEQEVNICSVGISISSIDEMKK